MEREKIIAWNREENAGKKEQWGGIERNRIESRGEEGKKLLWSVK